MEENVCVDKTGNIVEGDMAMRKLSKHQCHLIKRNRNFIVKVLLGVQAVDVKLTSTFQGIWVINSGKKKTGYDINRSESFEKIEEQHKNEYGTGVIGADILAFPETNLRILKFPFFIVDYTPYTTDHYDGLLGIGYNEENQSQENKRCTYDFFNWLPLFDSHNKRMMGFHTLNEKEGRMYLGDYPNEVRDNMKRIKTCPLLLNNNSHSWSCYLNAVYFDNHNIYQANEAIDFIIGGNFISVSSDFFLYLRNNYFRKELDEMICIIEEERFIKCKKDRYDITKFGDLSLVFGKMTIKLKNERLFSEDKQTYTFLINTINEKEKKKENWKISPSILIGYYMFLDKDDNTVGFYY